MNIECFDCGGPIGQDEGPPDGWQLEDGRTVCHKCCAKDMEKIIRRDGVLQPHQFVQKWKEPGN